MSSHRIRWLAVALLAATPLLRAESADSVPDDATLESSGAVIGDIVINSRQIFDLDDPAENRALYRLANRLHIRTRESAVRAQLLFVSGDRYSRRLLEETERNLRDLQFLREPSVRPLRYRDGKVDVLVETHDVWTLQLGPSYGRSGGKNESSLSFEDSNLFGRGKTLILGVSQDVDRDATYFQWRDPNIFGSRWADDFYWSDTSDGRLRRAALWRPFYSLNTRYSYGVSWGDSALTDTRYRLGEEYDDYRHTARRFDAYIGWSRGLQNGRSARLTFGWRTARDQFMASSGATTLGPLPADRLLEYPYISAELIRDRFITTRNVDLIDRTEDQHYGLSGTLLLGWADRALGADRRALIMEAAASYGVELNERQQMFLATTFNGRNEDGRGADLHWSATGAWYWRTSERTLLHIKVTGASGHAIDLDRYYELGGDNGLRGYPLRYQTGTGLTLLKIEERWYSGWSLWRLLDIGAAAFFDTGRVWGDNPLGVPRYGWLRDVGIGLRLGNSRSSLGNVIHVDLATPLDGEDRLDRVQLLVSTRATF